MMGRVFVVLWMVFFHIVDDYYLQGWLSSAKQKLWWEQNAPDALYKYDYIWALLMHSFSWAFMVMLPVAVFMAFNVNTMFLIAFIVNVCIHAMTDDLKANRRCINLWQDQMIHLWQVAATAMILLWT